MMAFGLGKLAHRLHKSQRVGEVAKLDRPLDAQPAVAQLPLRHLLEQAFGLLRWQWWDSTLAGCTGLGRQCVGHAFALRKCSGDLQPGAMPFSVNSLMAA